MIRDQNVKVDGDSSGLELTLLIAPVPFRPRHAYKPLTKIGYSLLP